MSDDKPASTSASFSLTRVLMVLLPIVLLAWGVKAYSTRIEQEVRTKIEKTTLWRLLGDQKGTSTLASDYKDADGDMIADAPQDEAAWIKPQELVFSYIATGDVKVEQEIWKEFLDTLSKDVGIPATLVSYANIDEQMAALREAKLHLTAFGTGEVETAVNQAGFVPRACFSNASGDYRYTMKLIVPAKSTITKPSEIRNRRLTFTRLRSNSGCIAALVMLFNEHKLQPDADYDWGVSRSHENSIKGIANGEYESAAVASDILERMIAAGEVKAEDIREIYSSEPFPPGVLGYPHNLDPDLIKQIDASLTNFKWSGTGLEKAYGGSGSSQFAMVDYKVDWAPVRELRLAAFKMVDKLGPPVSPMMSSIDN